MLSSQKRRGINNIEGKSREIYNFSMINAFFDTTVTLLFLNKQDDRGDGLFSLWYTEVLIKQKTDLSENPFKGEVIQKLCFQCLRLDGQLVT